MSEQKPLRAVIVHNRYQSAQPSGENKVVDADIQALTKAGVDVYPYIRSSDEIADFTSIGRLGLGARPIASPADSLAFRRLLLQVQPHVVHLHNPFPLISPWVVRTAKSLRVPVLQTVHNYRHACINGLLFRDGHPCNECLGKSFPWPAIQHGCYRDSRAQSIPMATAQAAHRGTWNLVDRFLPVGESVADHLRAMGIPDYKISVRPNAVADLGAPKHLGHGVLFVGRLTQEKGIELLLQTWAESGVGSHHTLTIAGDGNLRHLVEAASRHDSSIRYVGFVTPARVMELMNEAALCIVPSVCAEGDPLAAASALGAGRPVVATNMGAVARYIDSTCGWLSEPTVEALGGTLRTALADRAELLSRATAARIRFEQTRLPNSIPPLREIYESLCEVPRGVLVVVGPDGAGKSTVVDEIENRCQKSRVEFTRTHFRPRVIAANFGSTSNKPVTQPHAQTARRRIPALFRTLAVWVDFACGWLGPWRKAAQRGLVVVERLGPIKQLTRCATGFPSRPCRGFALLAGFYQEQTRSSV